MQNTFLQSGNDSKWFSKKSFFRIGMWHLRPPRDPPPFMAKTILNFHFDYWNPSLINTDRSSQSSDFLSSGTIDITLSTNLLALTILSLYATWFGPRVVERRLDPITSNTFFSWVVFFPEMRLFSIISRLKDVQLREGSNSNLMNFWKSSKGGEVGCHFQSKNLGCRFEEL